MPTLRELIDRPAISVEEHEPLARAAKRMYDQRVDSVVILHPDGGLAGIFTERDLLRACAAGVDTHASTVGHWMTEEPVTAPADTDAAAALQILLDADFRHLPVLGEGGVVGVVSLRALSRAVQAERAS
ncbi:MAG TPA: CBS domain-containing protein [Egibacteraceae bacterium]|nr:CBS domain-containing protein [Actinomycetota bacterium]HWB72494.1 CBS domain-containing protein [Egibacteraceae bacterium]